MRYGMDVTVFPNGFEMMGRVMKDFVVESQPSFCTTAEYIQVDNVLVECVHGNAGSPKCLLKHG